MTETTPDPNAAQLADLNRWLHDPTDTRTRDELRADLRALGNGIHPRNSVEELEREAQA